MTIRLTPRARDDLREILQYIAKENPAAAQRVGRAILDTAALIAARPYLGIRNAYPDERRIQGEDVVTWSHGSHTTKFGVDFNYIPTKATFTVNYGGVYDFGSARVSHLTIRERRYLNVTCER